MFFNNRNLCRGLEMCTGDICAGDSGDVSPSSGTFSSSSLMDGNVKDCIPFISDSCYCEEIFFFLVKSKKLFFGECFYYFL